MAGSTLGATGAAAADGPLAPGQTRTVVLAVPGSWAAQATQVGITALRLEQSENDCLEMEAAAGDDCTSDVGELAGMLEPTVSWGRTVEGECRAGGPAVSLDLFGTTTARLTEVDGVDCILLALAFPHGGSDNLAQSDTLAFGLELVGQGLPDPDDADPDDADPDDAADPGAPGPDVAQGGGSAGGAGSAGDVTGQGAGTQVTGTLSTGTQVTGATGDGAGQGTGQPGAAPAGVGTAGDRAAGDGTDAAGDDATDDGGPVLDRVEAQVEVGGEGVGVQTRAAGTSLQLLVLAWGGALLGVVGLGWLLFLLVLRRRRRAEAAA